MSHVQFWQADLLREEPWFFVGVIPTFPRVVVLGCFVNSGYDLVMK